MQAINCIGEGEPNLNVIWRQLQSSLIFAFGLAKENLLPKRFRPGHVRGSRFTHQLSCEIHLLERRPGAAKLKIGKGQSQVRFPVVRTQLQRSLKILGSAGGFLQIVEHETAVHVGGCDLGIEFQGFAEVVHGFRQLLVMCVNVTGDQPQILVFWKNRLVFFGELRRFIVLVQKKQIVGQVHRRFGITRQFLQHLVAEGCRFLVVTSPREITLALTHDLRKLIHGSVRFRAIEPFLG